MTNKEPRIYSDHIEFDAVLSRGAPSIPVWMEKKVNSIMKKLNVNYDYKRSGGNFDIMFFYFDRELSESEYEKYERSK